MLAEEEIRFERLHERVRAAARQRDVVALEELVALAQAATGYLATMHSADEIRALFELEDDLAAERVPPAVPFRYAARESLRAGFDITLAHRLSMTTARATSAAADSLLAYYGLPRLRHAVLTGEASWTKLRTVMKKTRDLSLTDVRRIDEFACAQPHDLTPHRLGVLVDRQAALIAGRENLEHARNRHRTVQIERWRDGTARLTLTGPTTALDALHQRTRAMARAITLNHADAFGLDRSRQAIVDPRKVNELMFDIITRATGRIDVTVAEVDGPATPNSSFQPGPERPAGTGAGAVVRQSPDPGGEDTTAAPAGSDTRTGSAHDPPPDTPPPTHRHTGSRTRRMRKLSGLSEVPDLGESETAYIHTVTLTCPTHDDWLRRQAAVTVTVPAMSLLDVRSGGADMPGELHGTSPVPAEIARSIVALAPHLERVLTDPVDGTVLPIAAQKYPIPDALRRTAESQWHTCAAPGCDVPAQYCEIDHLIPFDHADPQAGGRTEPRNLHPLCKHHHDCKTRGVISVVNEHETTESEGGARMAGTVWRASCTDAIITRPMRNPIHTEHAAWLAAHQPRDRTDRSTGGDEAGIA
ncbi:HNH endonuclease signature motif containing protein [Brevibacterium sp. CS2]|uniref:HNH endonuclease signature motif containing protein n=1 Tax=Brevibacterium sp. CS2 TaxID=2575923 RepID=UPI0010C7B593|nr:HNH endonuclease signature motif containing protein [Brevibacterium sp. CS2]QCP04267.1 HNH endonuclease [Brevibacterium sp. CS2]